MSNLTRFAITYITIIYTRRAGVYIIKKVQQNKRGETETHYSTRSVLIIMTYLFI